MNLSNILFTNIINKLELKNSLLHKEKFYVKNLLNQIDFLKTFKEDNFRDLSVKKINNNISDQNLLVMYIINISFLKANTTIHISDIKGNTRLFYSSGSVGLTGKQKKKRSLAISKLLALIFKKATFLTQKPIALHLNNVSFYKSLIIRKLKQNFYIRIIKSFNQIPYNGCRKKKLRRKKYTKKFR